MTAVDTRVLEVHPPASPSVVDLLLGGLDLLDLDGDLPADPDWWGRAVCAQTDPEAFFPEKGGSTREAADLLGMRGPRGMPRIRPRRRRAFRRLGGPVRARASPPSPSGGVIVSDTRLDTSSLHITAASGLLVLGQPLALQLVWNAPLSQVGALTESKMRARR